MPIVDGIVQNSNEWLVARIGCGTASRAGDMLAKPVRGNGELARRRNYREDLANERDQGRAIEHRVTPEMQWGIDHQDEARVRYEIETGLFLIEGGFWLHPQIPFFGASPDYLLPDGKGLVEVKCPTSRTHRRSFKHGEVDPDYVLQMAAQMACTGREYCDYVSYDPRFPEDKQFWVKRFMRDEAFIHGMEMEIEHFLYEVEQECGTGSSSIDARRDGGRALAPTLVR